MGKYTKAAPHLTRVEIEKRIKEAKDSESVRRWLVVWNATVEPRKAEEIALHTGVAKQTVHNIISNYNRFGHESLEGLGRGSRKRDKAYMSLDEEKSFLESFSQKAAEGQIATAQEIKNAFEGKIGKEVHKTTIYRLFKRHSWNKKAPRPYHPEQKEKEQEDFKKTFQKKQKKRLSLEMTNKKNFRS